MRKQPTISLLSSNTNNKLALSLLLDRSGYEVVFANKGKLAELEVDLFSQHIGHSTIVLDFDTGLGDTVSSVRKIAETIRSTTLIVLCEPGIKKEIDKLGLDNSVVILEKPLLPSDLAILLNQQYK